MVDEDSFPPWESCFFGIYLDPNKESANITQLKIIFAL